MIAACATAERVYIYRMTVVPLWPRSSVPIDRARVRQAALVGVGMVRAGVPADGAAAVAADARGVPDSERVAVLVDVERLVAGVADA